MLLCAVAALLVAGASEAVREATPAAVSQPTSAQAVPANTLVAIQIAEPISTRTLKPGDTFTIRLSAPVEMGGRTVIAAGTTGQGQVVDAGRAGMLGKPAKLVLAARYLDWEGRHIPLKGFQWAQAGNDMTSTVMVGSLIPYAGMLSLFIHGGEIDVPVGATALAKLAAPVELQPPSAAPGPAAGAAP